MMVKKIEVFSRLMAFLFTCMLIHYWKIIYLIIPGILSTSNKFIYTTMGLAGIFYLINGLAIVGLFYLKRWAYWVASLAVIYSTVFFATAYVPFISQLFFYNIPSVRLIIGNAVTVGCLIYLRTRIKKMQG